MVRIIISSIREAVYNLAFEAQLVENVKQGETIIFLWQNDHTIVVGRHQNPWKECLVEKFAKDGGRVIRRLSGGGAVYHDGGNLNFSIINHEDDYDVSRNISVLKKAMASLGFEVEYSGKNDLTIRGRKFSGHAFFKIGQGCCHHGAVLVDTNLAVLSHYLTPSKLKIQTKSVDSVRARVANLSDLGEGISVNDVSNAIANHFSAEADIEIAGKDDIQKHARGWVDHFGRWEWTYAESPSFDVSLEERYSWGTVELEIKIEGKKISSFRIYTDSNETEIFTNLIGAVEGCDFDEESLESEIEKTCGENPIGKDIKNLIKKLIVNTKTHR